MTIRNIEAWKLKLNETDVRRNTNLKELKNKNNGNLELHTKAKAGDVKSAVELVKRVVKQNVLDDLKQLAKEHNTAVVLPLLAKEETGHNKLPRAYADIIADATGLKVDRRIKQINKTNHTKENRTERLTDLAKFDGKVVKGQEYILVDDVLTTGSNINELRKYIERRGGKVIHVAVLATGIRGKEVFQPVVAETKKILYDKFERILNGQEKSETNITNEQQQQQEQNVDTTGNRRNDGRFPQGRQNNKRVRSESDLHRLVNLYLQSKNITNSVEELTEGQARDMLSDKFVIDEKHLFELLNSRFFQEQQQQNNPRGATTIFDRQYWIELFSSADKSTLLHESTHVFLSEVLYFANGKNPSPKILAIKKQLDDWLGPPENNGKYSTRHNIQLSSRPNSINKTILQKCCLRSYFF